MIGVIVQFQKWACVEKWKDTIPKWAQMTKVYYSSSKNGPGSKADTSTHVRLCVWYYHCQVCCIKNDDDTHQLLPYIAQFSTDCRRESSVTLQIKIWALGFKRVPL
jgi:hypothetical protein